MRGAHGVIPPNRAWVGSLLGIRAPLPEPPQGELLVPLATPPTSLQATAPPCLAAAVSGLVAASEGRRDFPEAPAAKKARGSASAALAVADSLKDLDAARVVLERGFYANSSRASVSAKRWLITELAERARRTRATLAPAFPLTNQTVLDVSATLLAAGFSSGASYLAELRLEHVERGAGITDTLARVFAQCKRSLLRARGPIDKAAELRWESVDPDVLLAVENQVAADTFVVACRFLLREIELANIRVSCILLPDGFGLSAFYATILLPVSKTDTSGQGASVTLQCTCSFRALGGPAWCAAHILARRLELVRQEGRSGDDFLFGPSSKTPFTKPQIVDLWSRLAPLGHPRLGGHSARRSGAKAYARAGWAVPDIQCVGRWAGPTILDYAEEAVRELPRGGDGRPILVGGAPPALAGSSGASEDVSSLACAPLAERLARVEADLLALRDVLKEEAGDSSQALVPAPEVVMAEPVERFLFNEASGILHGVASPPGGELPTHTCCRWKFVNSSTPLRVLTLEEAQGVTAFACPNCPSTKPFRLRSALLEGP